MRRLREGFTVIKILIDSASDIDLAEAKRLGVELIPMEVKFDDGEYLDGVDLSHGEFFEKLSASGALPSTSQINPFRFEEAFKRLTEDGSEVIAITISSKLSGTYKCALQAAEGFGGAVRVVDSMNASLGERLLCLYALRLIEEGCSSEDVCAELDRAKGSIKVLAVLDTLLYLKKGGRISAVTAFAGAVLSIKPVIGIIAGEVKLLGKAIGSKKGNNLLNQLVKENGVDFSKPYGVMWSGKDKTMLDRYAEDSSALWKQQTDALPEYMIGSTIGTHIGPGAIGVAFFSKK